jgi:chaperonin GroEL (HSP60 family)
MANQPIFILPEGTERYSKRDALRMNITAAKVLAGIVRTTLGPKGMDKMLVNSLGDVTVTNDGATIMREMEINQPAARMLVETAKKQEEIVGDGTTSVVVIAGELLSKAEELLVEAEKIQSVAESIEYILGELNERKIRKIIRE